MSNKKIIEHNLDFYLLEQDSFEPDEIFYSRVWYILSQLHSSGNKDNFDILIKKSRILANEKYHECKYETI